MSTYPQRTASHALVLHNLLHGDWIASEELHLLLEPNDVFLEGANITPPLIMGGHLVTVWWEGAQLISTCKIKVTKGEDAVNAIDVKDLRVGSSKREDRGDFEQLGPSPIRTSAAEVVF